MKKLHFVAGMLVLLLNAPAFATSFPAVTDLPSNTAFPDPLVMLDGTPVKTKHQWLHKRKPELKQLFQHYEYGFLPPPAKIKATVDRLDKSVYGGKATMKLVTIGFPPPGTPKIQLLVMVPNHRKKPAPVFVGLNYCGNHALVTNHEVPLPAAFMSNKIPGVTNNHATEASRGTLIDMWAIEQTVDRGYAVATFLFSDVQPDAATAKDGVRGFIHSSTSADDDWGTIAAWAWGIHRVVDYLVTDKDLNKHQIAVVGHSRFGKTAILAAAFDERIAMAIPLQAGCGGTAPSRADMGETVKQINDRFPHWFCGEFKKFNDQPEKLPFDQHCLIALCAPRPVLVGAATEDTWCNPPGMFEMTKQADKVYRLMATDGLAAEQMPEPNKVVDSTLGYFIRPGKHSMTKDDWKVFLDFADKHFGKPRSNSPHLSRNDE